MRKRFKSRLGFTMAEMLIVVAIITILGGIGVVAFQQRQRALAQVERDNIAKEIFVAAQNHLTMAKSENFHGETDFGTPGSAAADAGNDDIYFIYNAETSAPAVYRQILPFDAIEPVVQSNNFIIRYQPKAAVVLDVFYWTSDSQNSRYDCELGADDYATLVDSYQGPAHTSYSNGVLGWFGGEEPIQTGTNLLAPTIEVVNGEKLLVKVENTNPSAADAQLKLLITGETSKAMAALPISAGSSLDRVPSMPGAANVYTVVLDDITADGLHFAQIMESTGFQFLKDGEGENIPFIPGENIVVQAVAYSNNTLTNVAYSGEWTTNSLFAELGDAGTTAMIGKLRHLENLDARVSKLGQAPSAEHPLDISAAKQTDDLDWKRFVDEVGTAPEGSGTKSATLVPLVGDSVAGSYVPVTPSVWNGNSEAVSPFALAYDGMGTMIATASSPDPDDPDSTISEDVTVNVVHSVSNIVANVSGDAGMFGALCAGSSVKDLALVDFSVTSTGGNAGALAGTLDQDSDPGDAFANVDNVIAYNTATFDTAEVTTATVSAAKHAGGLIGAMTGEYGKVKNSAAALIVEATGDSDSDAGGLLGNAEGGAISGCYSGGHAADDTATGAVVYARTSYNVTSASGKAGGLIGDAGATDIECSYSTCSVRGGTAGGFVGNGEGDYTSCYATGLVNIQNDANDRPVLIDGAVSGAFAGAYSGTASDCHYFEIINESLDATTGNYAYMTAIAKVGEGDGTYANITAFDASATTYNDYAPAAWSPAVPYHSTNLKLYYGEGEGDDRASLYNLKSVAQLGATGVQAEVKENGVVTTPAGFVATHYGDWPAPEVFIQNTKNPPSGD